MLGAGGESGESNHHDEHEARQNLLSDHGALPAHGAMLGAGGALYNRHSGNELPKR